MPCATRSLLLLILLGALCLPACLEAVNTTAWQPDGSGTFVETVIIDLAKVEQARLRLKEAASLGEDDDLLHLDPFGRLDPKKHLDALKGAVGIEQVTSTQARLADGRLRYVLRGRFRSMSDLYESAFGDDMEASLRLLPKKKGWRFDARSRYDDPGRDVANRKSVRALRTQLLDSIRALLTDFRIQRTIVFPARVTDSNGTIAKDGRSVQWTIRFEDLAEPANIRQWALFEAGPKLKLEPFGEAPAQTSPSAKPGPKDTLPAKPAAKGADPKKPARKR